MSLIFYLFFYLDVAYVLNICCKYFIWMLRIFWNGFQAIFRCFLRVFHIDVASVFFHVTSVLYECCTNISGCSNMRCLWEAGQNMSGLLTSAKCGRRPGRVGPHVGTQNRRRGWQ